MSIGGRKVFACRMPHVAATLLLAGLVQIQPFAAESASLKIFWSKPVPALNQGSKPAPQDAPDTLTVVDVLSEDGRPLLLARRTAAQHLLFDADARGPGTDKRLPLKGFAKRLVQGLSGTLWVGGSANERLTGASWRLAEGYLGKLDHTGTVIAEFTFPSRGVRRIDDLASLPTGDILVAGREQETSWLARISATGDVRWERTFGIARGAAVALAGDGIIVVGFEGNDLVAWTFDSVGASIGRRIIRTDIAHHFSNFGRVAFVPATNALYVVSSWQYSPHAKPLEIVRLDPDGGTRWRRELPATIQESSQATNSRSCNEARIVLASGNILVACSIRNRILLFQLDSRSGNVAEASVPLPDCHEGRPAALFLIQRPDGAIWLLGSRPGGNAGASCTWLGELSLQPE
jgi:hypothetical protein